MTKWKPKIGETYYIPKLADYEADYIDIIWSDFPWDDVRYSAGFVCRTKEEALELAERMLAVAKEREKMTYDDLKEHIDAIAKYCDSVKCDNCLFGYDFGYYCTLRDVFPGLWEERFMEVKGND